MNFTLCGTEYFNYTNQTDVVTYGINEYNCLVDKNYTFAGDYYSENFEYLEIKVWKCMNSSTYNGCQNNTAIDNFFTGQSLSFAFVNTYFDFNDYVTPIKYFIDDSLFWDLEGERIKYTNFYV